VLGLFAQAVRIALLDGAIKIPAAKLMKNAAIKQVIVIAEHATQPTTTALLL
jgi:hypothetical protein